MNASVVIGANFGDEGKGLITDYLSALTPLDTVVVRFNGGAQAGHTVQQPNGQRHVFSHFSSGTLAGAKTYLSSFFIANPILFKQELAKLQSLSVQPKITIHPEAIVTTPYDMMINQIVEQQRGEKRHGSCGVGIHETIERNAYPKFQLKINDLSHPKNLRKKLFHIQNEWIAFRTRQILPKKLTTEEEALLASESIFEYFLADVETFLHHCDIADEQYLKKSEQLIFEGAQGLQLDQNHPNFPHVTRSNTGLQNVSIIATTAHIQHVDIYYVTRCYLTRHGAGPLPQEYPYCPYPYFIDQTNVPHPFQGHLRFAPLNVTQLVAEINNDLTKFPHHFSKKVTLAVTCLDHIGDTLTVIQNNQLIELRKKQFLNYLFEHTPFEHYLFSHGPTREDCKPMVKADFINASLF